MKEHLRILRPFFRGLPLIVLAMVVCALAAKKYLGYVTPMYESTAKLRLADISEGVPGGNLFKDLDVFASSNKIAAEIEVMKSSELLLKTLKKLDFSVELYRRGEIRSAELYHDSPLAISLIKPVAAIYDKRFQLRLSTDTEFEITTLDGQSLAKGHIGSPTEIMQGQVLVQLNEALIKSRPHIKLIDTYEFEFLSEEKQLDKINKYLDIISVDKDVPVIRINYKSNIPEKASTLVNALAETYIYDYIENKYQAAKTTVNFLDKQIEEAGSKLSQTENAIENYRNNQHITNIRQQTETDLRQISQMKIQQSNLKMNLEAIAQLNVYITQGKERFLELAPNFEAFTDLLSTEIIKNIKKLQADKKDLLLTYTANDEKVKVIDQKISDLTSYLIESIKNTRSNLQVKYDELSRDIETAKRAFETVPEKEKNMTILTREFDLMQSSYNFLNEKRIEAEIAQSAKIAFHRVISPATPGQRPVSPNRPIITIVFTILGMLISVVAIYTVHFMKAKVNDQYYIEQNSSVPVAVSTPYVTQNTLEVFNKNRIQLELKGLLVKGSILTISAFGEGEGRGFNLFQLCRTLASQGRRVLLVDAEGNLAHLRLQRTSQRNTWSSCIEGLSYYDLRADQLNAFSPEQLKELLNDLKREADLILVNNEFLEKESRALLFMSVSDHNLMVVDARSTPLKKIARLELLKEEYKLPDTWFLLNKAGYNPNVLKEILNLGRRLLKNKK